MTQAPKPAVPSELACERLGDLAAAASSDAGHAADPRAWARLERRLDRNVRQGMVRRWPVVATSAAVVACVTVGLAARQTLSYRTQGCVLTENVVHAVGSGSVVFEDGTALTLTRGSTVRIEPRAFARGAELALDDGAADVTVVHRHASRWAVLAGPFRVEVTGTRFALRWSKAQGRFHLAMSQGEVRVSGGPIPAGTRLRTGQVLEADAGYFAVEEARPAPAAAPQAAVPTAPSKTPPAAPIAPLPAAPATAPRRETSRRVSETRLAAAPVAAYEEPAWPPPSAGERPAPAQTFAAPGPSTPIAPLPYLPSEPPSTPGPATPTGPWHVAIASDGQLSGGMSGYAWLSGGEGTVFSMPVANLEHARLQAVDGKLCAQGRLARWSCVNEGMPSMRCNWDRNWGVAIGFFVSRGERAWGSTAPAAIAIDFRGRSMRYRLNFHRPGDPPDKGFCIENYKSGQLVRPSQAKSRCWDDAGDALSDFQDVDHVDLQALSGLEYVAFRYCISGITLYP